MTDESVRVHTQRLSLCVAVLLWHVPAFPCVSLSLVLFTMLLLCQHRRDLAPLAENLARARDRGRVRV
jgi:hypothetical protein